MAAGSSSHPSQMAFDVFLSFNRDEEDDGYRRFIKCLYETLSEWGIKMFMDDDKKMFMDDIKMLKDDGKKMFMDDEVNLSDDIVKAIEGSITSIVVLTKGYASSKWCLRELVKIIDQKNKTKHQVLPLFYRHLVHHVYHQSQDVVRHQSQDVVQHQSQDVVRRQSQDVRKFFRSMAEKDYSEVNYRTSLAMSEFCRLPGIYISRKNSNTMFQIKSTAKQIIDRLLSLKLEAKEGNLFEMPLRLRTMEMLLGLGSNDIRFIGIVGMSGIGKTTLAEVIYAHSFKSLISDLGKRCFLHSRGRSIVSLQQQLLDQLASSKMIDIQILDENHGVRLIKQHLRFLKKVLIVLDGISETSQLEMLAGSPDWFGKGSRIIITTTNKDIFRHPNFKDKVQEYNVELPSHEAAFSLFCKLAFGDYPPSEDMKDLCNEIIEKVGRLPLALEKIASSLYGHDMNIWEDTLKNFHKVVYDNIFSDILKSSYEGLEAESQQIFLDLACFLNGEKVDRVIEILQGFGYSSPQTNLQLLVDRCLIDILDGHIQMHILILCMGKEIVRRKLGTCQQTRIWLRDDARRLFHENNELKYICGIVMDLEEEEELVLKAKAFAGMSELKILRINNVQLSEDIEFLSNKLTLLNWPGYPSKYLPSTFQPPSLIELHLPGSNVERLWNGTQLDLGSNHFERLSESIEQLINLKVLYLNDCHKLKQVPKLPQSIRYVGGEKSLGMLTTSQGTGSPACTMSPSSSNAPLLTNNDNFQKTDHKLILSHKTSLVGMENQVEKVCNLLDLKRSKDTLFVGIFGSSGIGKTTIAEVVYNTIVDQFQSGCFLYLSSKPNSLVPLQHQMLSHLLSKESKIWDEDHGAQLVKHHMSNRKVLIVLDGVDERNQIEKLVGSPNWFAPGSRVIITARNRDVLHQLDYRDQVQEYKVELLSPESAYSLFCKNAFGDGPYDKNDLCSEIVEKVGRLPLALRTIGSYLHNKELEVWNETLKRLDEVEQNFFDTISQRTQKKTTPTLGQI
uniref:Resistance gene-like protein n=1 Tax=Cucumis melo TaxID=3656 RepID=A0A7L9RV10_CUCME|nr:resistance gene-like protein [Cucumis melo]